MEHNFKGRWISDGEMARLMPRNVFSRQLAKLELDCTQYRNRHVLFRRSFNIDKSFSSAKIYISADDYYKLYINGRFVGQGPSPSYHFRYNYNEINIANYLVEGENVIAVHTLYQGLVNRVWQSADMRHGLICDIEIDGDTLICSDESFKVARHSGYTESGVCGYQTQFLERYDSGAAEVGFETAGFDDEYWESATICRFDDHVMQKQESAMLEFEDIYPEDTEDYDGGVLYDFGANYVGYLSVVAKGKRGQRITVRCAQEKDESGRARFDLRANCKYEEDWVLSGGEDTLEWFDYKSFRYAEIDAPEGVEISAVRLIARHYPFECRAKMRDDLAKNELYRRIWNLCVNTQKYGVQEVIQDCMEREKGFYLGDGCYTALANMILTGDDSMVRKLIDDAFASSFICDTLVTCMDCSFMQEIAEYPLIMISLLLWHYRYTGDSSYLKENYAKAISLMDAYRRDYERDGLLRNLDKWCVVEWPKNYQHGYDADIREGKICEEAHIAINAYYIYALRIMNEIAKELGEEKYRDTDEVVFAFYGAFYDESTGLFFDSERRMHASLVGNAFAYSFDLCPNEKSKKSVLDMIDSYGISSLSLFCTFPVMMRFAKEKDEERLRLALSDSGAWQRMLDEGATTTFEGWGKETKWNTSLFHLTMSYAAVFLADAEVDRLFE